MVSGVSAVTPVATERGVSCGRALQSYPYLGDPSSPDEPAFVYEEYVACGEAARGPHAALTLGLLGTASAACWLTLRLSRRSMSSTATALHGKAR
jgi:hypothetical protein